MPAPRIAKSVLQRRGSRRAKGRPEEPSPPPGVPAKPAIVRSDSVANSKWDALVPQLVEHGIITEVDEGILMLYCTTWSRLLMLNKIVDAEGFISAGRNGIKQRHPAQALANTATKQLLEMGKQLSDIPQ